MNSGENGKNKNGAYGEWRVNMTTPFRKNWNAVMN